YFIYFEVDTQTIDINIHPTKTEIKFENEQALWSILSATVKEALGKFNIVPSIDFDQEGAPEMPVQSVNLENIRPPQTSFNPNYNPFASSSYKRPEINWEKLYGGFEDDAPEAQLVPQFEEEEAFSVPNTQQDLHHVFQQEISEFQSTNFQLKNKFVITNVKSGMLMIDQHRAHVRILFESFLQQMLVRKVSTQQVLFPETLELHQDDALYFEQILDDLNAAGFDFNMDDRELVQVTGVPAQLGTESVVALLKTLIEKARTTALNSATEVSENIALALAEASSIKSGQSLTNEEMSDLINRLFACENPNHTPDGKTTMVIFSQDEIMAKFR
ncbi:MAG: DNA mismatch repair protein MutL, partial [Paludibacter sp.]|nr:DNA mismatch repair protein MutL [Paludibacter sp.]